MTLTLLQQIENLFELQDTLNSNISGKDWRNGGNNYMLAAAVECAEAIDHFGYKWWKAGEANIPQIKLELVDILFFTISDLMAHGFSTVKVVRMLEECTRGKDRENDLLFDLRWLFQTVSNIDPLFEDVLLGLMECVYTLDMTFTDLYKLYIGKAVLNLFRQDHGYKDGSYIKHWNGLEDNEVLFEIVDGLADYENLDYTQTLLYMKLEQQYPG